MMRLNKYLASCGVASRRKSEEIIKAGHVFVNNTLNTNPFCNLDSNDQIRLDGDILSLPEETVVILLNKPQDIISTVIDTHNRKTVLNLIDSDERLFPIGRLDKDTTGVILLTNNGELSYKLTHPKFGVEKVYQVTIDKILKSVDRTKIQKGVDIGDGQVGQGEVVDIKKIANTVLNRKVCTVTIKLIQGKKREVKRIFSALRYKVLSLHRESFAGITCDGLLCGEWRQLSKSEISRLKT